MKNNNTYQIISEEGNILYEGIETYSKANERVRALYHDGIECTIKTVHNVKKECYKEQGFNLKRFAGMQKRRMNEFTNKSL